MRRLIAALMLAAVLGNATAVQAAEPKKWRPTLFGKLDAWQTAIAASHLLPGYFLQIAAHEGVVAKGGGAGLLGADDESCS